MPDDDRDEELLRLDDALKLAGLVGTGGEAKVLIQSGEVRVNGVVETRRKRKLSEGDVIEVGDEIFEIALADDDAADDDGEGSDDGGAPGDVFLDDEDDEDDVALDEHELDEWRAWIEERVAERDVEAVIIRMGGLAPRQLEAVFARLPRTVEEVVLDALDEVLERTEGWDEGGGFAPYLDEDEDDDGADDPDRAGDGPLRA